MVLESSEIMLNIYTRFILLLIAESFQNSQHMFVL